MVNGHSSTRHFYLTLFSLKNHKEGAFSLIKCSVRRSSVALEVFHCTGYR